MEIWMIVLVLVLTLAAVIAIGWWSVRSSRRASETAQRELTSLRESQAQLHTQILNTQNAQLIQQQEMQESLRRLLSDGMEKSSSQIHRQLSIVPDIQRKLGELEEQARNIARVGRDMSELGDLLKPPKIRGRLGEMFLANLLDQVFPRGVYQTEYSFRDKSRVDAVIKINDSLLPIDSKFPLESFRRLIATPSDASLRKRFLRDVKGHIDKVSGYVRPDEGTTEFALLYFPSEAVYAESVVSDDFEDSLISYALDRRVVLTSPSLMYAYLRTLAGVLRGFEIATQGREILNRLSGLNDRFSRFQTDFERIGSSIKALTNNYRRADSQSDKFAIELQAISSLEKEDTLSGAREGPQKLTLTNRKSQEAPAVLSGSEDSEISNSSEMADPQTDLRLH